MNKAVIGLLLSFSFYVQGQEKIQIDLGFETPAPRWQFEKSAPPKSGLALSLYRVKREFVRNNYNRCYFNSLKSLKQTSTLKGWLSVYRLKCARLSASKKSTMWLRQSLQFVRQRPYMLITGAHKKELRREFLDSLISLSRSSRKSLKRSKEYLHEALDYKAWASKEQLSLIYEFLGDLQVASSSYNSAFKSYTLANDYMGNRNLGKKLNDSKSKVSHKFKGKVEAVPEKELMSEAETQIYDSFKKAAEKGQVPLAIEVGANYLKNYPTGFYWERVSKKITTLLNQNRRKPEGQLQALVKRAKKAPPHFLTEWGDYFYNRARPKAAHLIYEAAVDYGPTYKNYYKALFRSAYSAYQLGDYAKAKANWDKVADKSHGYEKGILSYYYLGLVNIRLNQFKAAISAFDAYVTSGNGEFRLQALYWGWRSMQRVEDERAPDWQKIIIAEFSLTYYGLRAQLESADKKLIFSKHKDAPQKLTLNTTAVEMKSWKKVKTLLKAGWLKEADTELKTWDKPVTPSEKLLQAHLFSHALNHFKAIVLIQEVYEEYPTWKQQETLELVYPQEFSQDIKKYASTHKIEPNLVKALIKQESSYLTYVSSSAGAMGLMQLMRPTALEMNRRLKLGALRLPSDLEKPDKNIRLGTYYMRRLLNAFNGHVPLSLASYNVGIGNIRKWQKRRADVQDIENLDVNDPFSELWYDELAWSETSFYVKAILRNLIVYRWLDKGTVSPDIPIWKSREVAKK